MSGICWGAMGVCAQYLLHSCQFTTLDLISSRIVAAGLLVLIVEGVLVKNEIFSVFKNFENIRDTLIYTLSIIGVQYSFFSCITVSNAATGAILATTCPLWIMAILVFKGEKKVSGLEVLLAFVMLLGVFLLVTKGSLDNLKLSLSGLFWGLLSAMFSAVYTLQPQKLMSRVGVGTATGWAMLLTGILVTPIQPFWRMDVIWNSLSVFDYSFIVLFGTVISFWCYMASSKLIPPEITGLMETVEPVTSVLLSIFIFHLVINDVQLTGIFMIFASLIMLSIKTEHKVK